MRKFFYFWLACVLLMPVAGCKSKQKVVESVRYVHDTAFSRSDSIFYRVLDFSGTETEKTAVWHVRDTVNNTDTVFKYRYREVRGRSLEDVKSEKTAAALYVKRDSTGTTTTKLAGNGVKAKGGGNWLLFVVVGLLVINVFLYTLLKKGKVVF